MENIKVTAGDYGIIFHLPTTKYSVGWWQIMQSGFTAWYSHLCDKNWFSDEVRRMFTDLCRKHFNWI